MTAATDANQLGAQGMICENRSLNENQYEGKRELERGAIGYDSKRKMETEHEQKFMNKGHHEANAHIVENNNNSCRKREAESIGLWKKYDNPSEPVRCKSFGGRTERLLSKAKRNHRTDISSRDWGKFEYAKRWTKVKAVLEQRDKDNVCRIHGPDITRNEFQRKFEKAAIPCLITGLADHWKARSGWEYGRLRQEFGERLFKCGEDDDGYPIKVKLKHFLRYQNSSEPGGALLDDSPLYIFDSHFDDDRVNKKLLEEYEVPHLFNEDLFKLVGEKSRPPYRWVLFGPARSGSCIHIDPLGTSAWNTLVRGHKLWALFPPHFKKKFVKGKEFVQKGEDDEAIDWFVNLLPRILEKGGDEARESMIMFIQRPGETVYVPTDWWHSVLNLDATIAVTQNFCSSGNFDAVWRKTRTGRKRMAGTWLESLKEHRPDLARRAQQLDSLDGYDLKKAISDVIAKRLRKKQERERRKQRREEAKKNGEKIETETSSSSESSSSDD